MNKLYKQFSTLFERLSAGIFLTGQIIVHILQAKIYRLNTIQQMIFVGQPQSPSLSSQPLLSEWFLRFK